MSLKHIIGIVAFGLSVLAFAAWPGVEYTQVRAYAFNLDGKSGTRSIVVDGKIHPTVVNPAGAKLTKKQEQALLAALSGKHPFHPVMSCFIPRHAFIFFSGEKIVAKVDVCFQCLGIRTEPEDHDFPDDIAGLADLCRELGLPMSPGPDFRKELEEWRQSQK